MSKRPFGLGARLFAAAFALAAPLAASAQPALRMAFVAPAPVWGPIADHYAKEVADRTSGVCSSMKRSSQAVNSAGFLAACRAAAAARRRQRPSTSCSSD